MTDILKLQGTSGNGTLTSPAIQLKVGNNGATTAMTVLNNGNVGIGTTTPIAPFSVHAESVTSGFHVSSNGSGLNGRASFSLYRNTSAQTGWQFLKDENDDFIFRELSAGVSTQRMVLKAGGNVGIGTGSPDYTFQVVGGIKVGTGSGGAGTIITSGNNFIIKGLVSDTTGSFIFSNSNGANIIVARGDGQVTIPSGNVGIGTTAPTAKLQIKGAGTTTGANFQTLNSAGTALVTGLDNGKVGIGTGNPGYKLHVSNSDIVSAVIESSNSSWAGFEQRATVSGAKPFIQFYNSADSKKAWIELNPTTNVLGFITNASATPKMVIDSSGNVGINTTTPTAKLQIKGEGTTTGVNFQTLNSAGTALITGLDNGNVGIGTTSPNALVDVSGNVLADSVARFTNTAISSSTAGAGMIGYSDDGAAISSGDRLGFFLLGGATDSSHTLGQSVGILGYASENWSSANRGSYLSFATTANGSSSRLERMRIDHNGNVGIGTTTPTQKLQVIGSALFNDGSVNDRGITITPSWTSGTDNGITLTTYGVSGQAGSNGTFRFNNVLGNLVTIDSGGNVGINTTAPTAKLQIKGAGTGTGLGLLVTDSAGTAGLTVRDDGKVGIGNITTPTQALDVAGSIAIPMTTTSTSGVLYKDTYRFLHNYKASGTQGENFFAGISAGNFTMFGTGSNASYNTGVGTLSLTALTTGSENTAVGYNTLSATTGGNYNSAFGKNALASNNAWYNVAIGMNSLTSATTGGANSALGNGTLQFNVSGGDNVAVGYLAGRGTASLSNIAKNVLIGFNAGLDLRTGADSNIMIGYGAGDNVSTGASNILIGANIDAQSATGSSQLSIGNVIFGTGGFGTGTTVGAGNIGIGTTTPGQKLSVAGTLGIRGGSYYTVFQGGAQTANLTYTLSQPPSPPLANN